MLERQVRYNIETATGEQEIARHKWTVLIINEPREIKRIKERLYLQLDKIVDFKNLYHEQIDNSGGLHCEVFSFSSSRGKIEDSSKVYNSKRLKRDRDLEERNDVYYDRFLRAILDGRKQ
jgi:hypothetical protein